MKKLFTLLALFLAAGCVEDPAANDVVRREGEPDAVRVSASDPELVAARAEAQQTFPEFLSAVAAADTNDSEVAVKLVFAHGDTVEYLWVDELRLGDGVLFGEVANTPLRLESVRLGDTVRVDPQRVADWMLVRDGVLRGGFTVRVYRKRMSASDRASSDSAQDYRIDSEVVLPDGA